ncbi:MAG: threonine synthase [Elusimicrobia bacterium GWA2_69_24]|nr:MAG: threonine synthase [Elusimicrobia bacterium GWA2_69_24]HBL16980.1 threonine synthase [Elusimicrobiota bacterium]
MKPRIPLIEKYRARLPVSRRTPVVSLLEGGTPLVPAPRLAALLGRPGVSVFLKIEGANPTGSFKDRGMTLAMSKALEARAPGVLCASTGNTSASAAAYAARAGLRCMVLLPAGNVAAGKLSQAVAHGAEIVSIRGNFDAALELAKAAAADAGWTLVNSLNPYRIEGQKTAAFEVVEDLGRAPDFQFMPVGNAGNITAYWKGYRELCAERRLPLPRMMGWQAAGAAPIVRGRKVEHPETFATAIRIGNPASWQGALAARDESRGLIGAVTDREILAAYRALAGTEGVFCEPASAAGVAGLLRFARGAQGRRLRGARVVCILTGHGLKDPDSPSRLGRRIREIAPDLAAVRRLMGGRRGR